MFDYSTNTAWFTQEDSDHVIMLVMLFSVPINFIFFTKCASCSLVFIVAGANTVIH